MTSFHRRLLMLPLLALGACAVAPPSHSTVVSLPGPGKSFRQFQGDDAMCQTYASSMTADAQAAAARQSDAVGAPAPGVLSGAGFGLLGGAAVAGDNARGAATSLQGRFDTAYAQCMVGNGETIEPPSGPADEAAPVVYAPVTAVIVGPGD